jgi:hypothetical protein
MQVGGNLGYWLMVIRYQLTTVLAKMTDDGKFGD